MSETPDQNTTGVADTIRTAQQLDIERKAARLLLEPGVQTAIGDIGAQWVQSRQPGSELQALFEREFGQIACCSAINVFNADPVHPMVHAFCRFEHETDGLRAHPQTPRAKAPQSDCDQTSTSQTERTSSRNQTPKPPPPPR